MEFTLYKEKGAYHWDWYETNPQYKAHADKVADWITEDDILDIGAGDGLITSLIQNKGKVIIGIDDNTEAIRLAQIKNINVLAASVYDFMPFEFNAVLMADVIEHLKFPKKALINVHRLLRNHGKLYITTPPVENSDGTNKFHVHEYSAPELVEMVEGCGFRLVGEVEIANDTIYAKFEKV